MKAPGYAAAKLAAPCFGFVDANRNTPISTPSLNAACTLPSNSAVAARISARGAQQVVEV
jgi:hypothetical protein